MIRLLTQNGQGRLICEQFGSEAAPPYAILSHTWDEDDRQEVFFEDILTTQAHEKAGWKKIDFCSKQIQKDGLNYFWIDTCCIKQSNEREVTEAINSMFRWYQQAARCYVYLSDVIVCEGWEASLSHSRWFTRGWTLQELIAPKLVHFFASDGQLLGHKSDACLESLVSSVTGISKDVLRGGRVADCSVEERLSWTRTRQTKLKEDGIYCLLGIFDVSMAPIYGEGETKALRRLNYEIWKSCK
jgi:hypothetical protein